ncbi:MAG: GTP 3',8-cyclase MoaA [Acidobacteria bacterium]|nr:GTP 3',8-cyclase MoaA [Acidobacteriota bacterium]
MLDGYDRQINYLRISLTDRCNLRCFYCRGVSDFSFIDHGQILTYEEFLHLARLALKLGVDRFRLTGGEPLVRKGVPWFISQINSLPGVKDVSLTTNGILLERYIGELKEAGLRRINISLDTLDREKYQKITGYNGLSQVLSGLELAVRTGFNPVKVNTVILKDFNDDRESLSQFINLTFNWPVHLRFIELMEFSPVKGLFVSATEIFKKLKDNRLIEEAELEPVFVEGSGPAAHHYRLPGMKGTFGFIAPYSHHFCGTCNRLRLTADGQLRTCLFSTRSYDIKEVLRRGAGDEEVIALLKKALAEKPGSWQEAGGQMNGKGLRSVGG